MTIFDIRFRGPQKSTVMARYLLLRLVGWSLAVFVTDGVREVAYTEFCFGKGASLLNYSHMEIKQESSCIYDVSRVDMGFPGNGLLDLAPEVSLYIMMRQ